MVAAGGRHLQGAPRLLLADHISQIRGLVGGRRQTIVDVERQLLEAFATATGLGQLPPPQHLDAMRWRFAIPDQPLPERSYLDADAGIGIAGDWCGGPRVEGAWLSGDDLARRLLES